MNKRDQHQLETGQKYMKTMKKIFEYIGRTIAQKTDTTFSYPEEWSEMKKKRVQNKYAQLRKGIDSNRFMLNENENIYTKSMMDDRNRLAVESSAKEERKKMHDEIYYNKRRQEELEQSRRRQEEQELEKRAQLDLRMATELKMNLNNAKIAAPNKKKKMKKHEHEIIEDDEGNMPLQNFAGGANDEEENSFKFNFQTNLDKIDTTRRPKNKKEKKQPTLPGEKKRLKKKIAVNDKDSDEDLSLESVPEESQPNYPRQKPTSKKPKRLEVEDSDGDESDLADRMNDVNDDDEAATQTQNVNFGDKNDDHENVF